ncbi:MAG: UDP-2,4-diacetamido-2,4,6-trideoxy-beta-L-altropyranose hydrolase [Thermacetogeniaceae bacterium]
MVNDYILFRADGGPDIGMGHIIRCLALAAALALPVGFLSRPNTVVRKMILDAGFDFLPLGDESGFVAAIESRQPLAVIVDSYTISSEELAAIKSRAASLVVIDDMNTRYLSADLLINGNITAPALNYVPDKKLLLGTKYALLRPAFGNCQAKTIARRAQKLMVTLGGSDPLGLMPSILEELSDSGLHIKAVIGPQFTNGGSIERWLAHQMAAGLGSEIELVADPEMALLMQWADLAVSAGGSTLYELCATGLPAVAISISDNQAPSAGALGKAGCIRYFGNYTEPFLHDRVGTANNMQSPKEKKQAPEEIKTLIEAVNELAVDYDQRFAMSRRGQQLVDGCGAKRCAGAIRDLVLGGRTESFQ